MTTVVTEAEVLAGLRQIRWDDIEQVAAQAPPLLRELVADPAWLGRALEEMFADEHLRSLSERLEIFDKVVLLHDRASGVRLRMHIFHDGYVDTPHNHRFNFTSLILAGGYEQTLYGDWAPLSLDLDPAVLRPRFIRQETAGSAYTIEHTLLHSVRAAAQTVTLTVRGPAQKDRMLVMGSDGAPFWAFGMADEDEQERTSRRLSSANLAGIRELLRAQGLVR
ncbi:hypothetical protein [Jatrophihabitans sp.]|uniref:hypothetical protein n=1 Tax=Jatrophihabitans sp. TaxID=1932789 RepID=UPI002C2CBAFF|nr:hypothetical protein [Jatrophihabitans sp.]